MPKYRIGLLWRGACCFYLLCGLDLGLEAVKKGFAHGAVSKDDYEAAALRGHRMRWMQQKVNKGRKQIYFVT